MTPALFSPLALGSLTVPNRIAVAPMCQYSARDGCPLDWHLQHWMNLAMSGAGLVMVEATAVERRGRITHGDLGLYCDDNERTIGRALAAARAVALPGTLFGIQLAHAGRKASAQRPWEGGGPLRSDEDPWQTVAPSALPVDAGWHTPKALDEAGLEGVRAAFCDSALRAVRLGFEVIELHSAKPPKHTQFPKGASGNPTGPGKRPRSIGAAADKALSSRVPVVDQQGRRRSIPAEDLIMRRFRDAALNGDVKSAAFLMDRAERYRSAQPEMTEAPELSPEDIEILESMLDRKPSTPKRKRQS